MLIVLQISLKIQGTSKVNSSDNNIECATSRIGYITSSNMKLFQKNTKLRIKYILIAVKQVQIFTHQRIYWTGKTLNINIK